MFTICCIGVGRWGQNIARVLAHLRDQGKVDEIIICDKNRDRAKLIAERYNIERFYHDIDELLCKEDVDAFVVAVPTKFHYEIAMKLAKHGDLFIEKPIACNTREAREIIKLCEREDRILMIGHIVRYEPATRYLLYEILPKLKKNGEEVEYINAERIGPGPFNPMYTLNLGVSHDLMVHDVDIANVILGELPREVRAFARYKSNFPYEVDIVALFKYPSEVTASLHASWLVSTTLKKRNILVQTKSYFIGLDSILQKVYIERGLVRHSADEGFIGVLAAYQSKEIAEHSLLAGPANEPLLIEMNHFIDCIKHRRPPLTNGVVGYIALKCIEGALESARKGISIRLTWDEEFIDENIYSMERYMKRSFL
ncbi:MAG: hypothetical protein DRJ66_06760 [Thermoprotei archaeon]|nr:MAG: hypothetical protein DRJ66_06760 [Thermoprotei archaeon]RLF20660.1 MAG: hypothetical protein DRZ82_01405 [Thermoprotei archaeon]